MDDEKISRVKVLEQSLIQYLMGKRDVEEKMGSSFRRIRTLQLSIDDKDPKHPTFSVQIGMFAAEFNVANGLKEKGSCFNLERYIRDWSERESIRGEMMAIVTNTFGDNDMGVGVNIKNTLK